MSFKDAIRSIINSTTSFIVLIWAFLLAENGYIPQSFVPFFQPVFPNQIYVLYNPIPFSEYATSPEFMKIGVLILAYSFGYMIFGLFHSFTAHLEFFNRDTNAKVFYNICSFITFSALLYLLLPVPQVIIWNPFNIQGFSIIPLIFLAITSVFAILVFFKIDFISQVTGKKNITVNGVFSLVRHPTYFSLLCIIVITPTMTLYRVLHLVGVLSYLVLFGIAWEESNLVQEIPNYLEYMATTPRLIPNSSSLKAFYQYYFVNPGEKKQL